MSILINEKTKIICQGMTGKQGSIHSQLSLKYGSQIVGGVVPGKGGKEHFGLPLFNTVEQAVKETSATASMVFVPAVFCKAALLEAIDANLSLIVCITEGMPIHDMLYIKNYLKERPKTILIGPNSPGIICPGLCKIGIIPNDICISGEVGIVSRSGTLLYEVIKQMTDLGIGQSACVGIGGDPILGTDYRKILLEFERDQETKTIILLGEIGGRMEIDAAHFIRESISKPVIAYLVGKTAVNGVQFGHAGALIRVAEETVVYKEEELKKAGVHITESISEVVSLVTSLSLV